MKRFKTEHGYSLFELVIVIVIVGILATITMRGLRSSNEVLRIEETRREMDRLAWAIAGNPALRSNGARVDFGYVGDIGAVPPNLDALVHDPGFANWRGPYLSDEFSASPGASDQGYKVDAWGQPYHYTGLTLESTGGDGPLTRIVAPTLDGVLYNTLRVVVSDLDGTPPGTVYRDSILAVLTRPNGTGGLTALARRPQPDGLIRFDSVPIGVHSLSLVFLPTADTSRRKVVVLPDHESEITIPYHLEVW